MTDGNGSRLQGLMSEASDANKDTVNCGEGERETGDCVLYSVDLSNPRMVCRNASAKSKSIKTTQKLQTNSQTFHSFLMSKSKLHDLHRNPCNNKLPDTQSEFSSSTCTSYLSLSHFVQVKASSRGDEPSPAGSNTPEHPDDQEPTSADEPDATEDGNTV
jgi:hypothetical protein